jgi:hypothetical protein
MRGRKDRAVAPLIQVSLAQLVPVDNCYRHHDKARDLSFVRELVAPCYAAGGRPSSAHPAAEAEMGCNGPAAESCPRRPRPAQRLGGRRETIALLGGASATHRRPGQSNE